MSLLESFYIAFDSNSEEAEKKIGSSVASMAKQVLGAAAAFMSLNTVMGQVTAAADYADRLGELSTALGLNIEELSAYSDAVKMSGGDTSEFQNTISTLARDMAAFAATGKGRVAPFFKELGIDMTDVNGKARNVMDVLPELADAFEGLSKEESFGLGQKLGLDQGTIMLLQSGRRSVDDLVKRQKELGAVTKEDAEVAAKFNDALDDTSHVFRTLFMRVGTTVLPGLTLVLEKVQELTAWFSKHEDLVVGFFGAVSAAIAAYYLPAIWSAASGTIAALAPFLLVTLAIAAFGAAVALVYDDVMNFLSGGESVTGMIVDMISAFADLASMQIGDIFDNIASAWESMVGRITDKFEWIANKYKAVAGIFGGSASADLSIGQTFMADASAAPSNNITSSSINAANSTRNSSVKIDKVEVNTQATDADGVAKGIGDSLHSEMAQVVASMDDGVSH